MHWSESCFFELALQQILSHQAKWSPIIIFTSHTVFHCIDIFDFFQLMNTWYSIFFHIINNAVVNTLSLTSFKCVVLTLELLKGKCWANVSQIFTFILIIKCLFIHIPTNILSIFCHSNGCSLVFEGIFPTFLVKLRDSVSVHWPIVCSMWIIYYTTLILLFDGLSFLFRNLLYILGIKLLLL